LQQHLGASAARPIATVSWICQAWPPIAMTVSDVGSSAVDGLLRVDRDAHTGGAQVRRRIGAARCDPPPRGVVRGSLPSIDTLTLCRPAAAARWRAPRHPAAARRHECIPAARMA
jgi:hypothetical protein